MTEITPTMTDTKALEALKPCPFCGDADPEITGERRLFWVACTAGSECLSHGPKHTTEAQAIVAWNLRAALSPVEPERVWGKKGCIRTGRDGCDLTADQCTFPDCQFVIAPPVTGVSEAAQKWAAGVIERETGETVDPATIPVDAVSNDKLRIALLERELATLRASLTDTGEK